MKMYIKQYTTLPFACRWPHVDHTGYRKSPYYPAAFARPSNGNRPQSCSHSSRGHDSTRSSCTQTHCVHQRWLPPQCIPPDMRSSWIYFNTLLYERNTISTSKTLFGPITSTGDLSPVAAVALAPISWMIVVYSSSRQFSPMMMGPDTARIVTRGWTTQPLEMVMSPRKTLSSFSQTVALGQIFSLYFVFVLAAGDGD